MFNFFLRAMHKDRWMPIAIGHQSDSGDLKIMPAPKFSQISNKNSLFNYYLPFERGIAIHQNKREYVVLHYLLNKLKSLLLKDPLCQVWLVLEKT